MKKDELLIRIEQGWNEFQAYIQTLSAAQLAGPTDAAGWTAKDHIMHLAVWEDGIDAARIVGTEWAWTKPPGTRPVTTR